MARRLRPRGPALAGIRVDAWPGDKAVSMVLSRRVDRGAAERPHTYMCEARRCTAVRPWPQRESAGILQLLQVLQSSLVRLPHPGRLDRKKFDLPGRDPAAQGVHYQAILQVLEHLLRKLTLDIFAGDPNCRRK